MAAVLRPAGELAGQPQRARLILAAGILVAAGFLLWPKGLGQGLLDDGSADENSVPVLVAKQYIPPFTRLNPSDVEVRYYPAAFVPPGALNSRAELENDHGQGLYASVAAIPETQPLTRAMLMDAGQPQRMASLIRPGRVAVSFAVDKARAAGGWVQPGDAIAVYESLPLPPGPARAGEKATRLLFSALPVLAVDQRRVGQQEARESEAEKSGLIVEAAMDDPPSRVLTVLTTPSEAVELLEARERGTLSVVLRAFGDDAPWPVR